MGLEPTTLSGDIQISIWSAIWPRPDWDLDPPLKVGGKRTISHYPSTSSIHTPGSQVLPSSLLVGKWICGEMCSVGQIRPESMPNRYCPDTSWISFTTWIGHSSIIQPVLTMALGLSLVSRCLWWASGINWLSSSTRGNAIRGESIICKRFL